MRAALASISGRFEACRDDVRTFWVEVGQRAVTLACEDLIKAVGVPPAAARAEDVLVLARAVCAAVRVHGIAPELVSRDFFEAVAAGRGSFRVPRTSAFLTRVWEAREGSGAAAAGGVGDVVKVGLYRDGEAERPDVWVGFERVLDSEAGMTGLGDVDGFCREEWIGVIGKRAQVC